MRKNGTLEFCGYNCVLHAKPVQMTKEKLQELRTFRGDYDEIFEFYKKPSLRKINIWHGILNEIGDWFDNMDAWVHITSANGFNFNVEGIYKEDDNYYSIRLTSKSANAWRIEIIE